LDPRIRPAIILLRALSIIDFLHINVSGFIARFLDLVFAIVDDP
jgi:hypothetical protein